MGESKRRKKILGTDYGKVLDFSRMSRIQVEQHIDKFIEAWMDYFFKGEEIKFTLFNVKIEQWKTWLENYLKPYTPKSRVILVTNFMIYWEKIPETGRAMFDNYDDISRNVTGYTFIFYHLSFPYLSRDYLLEFRQKIKDFKKLMENSESFQGIKNSELMKKKNKEEVERLEFIRELIEGLPVPTSMEN